MAYIGLMLFFAALIVAIILRAKSNVSTISGGSISYQKSGNTEVYTTERFVEIKTTLNNKEYKILVDDKGVVVNGKLVAK